MKTAYSIASLICSFVVFPLMAFAQGTPRLGNPVGRIGTPLDIIGILVQIFQLILSPVVIVLLIFAGFKIVSARGDEKALSDGKRALIWGLVGATILIGGQVIMDIVVNTVSGLEP